MYCHILVHFEVYLYSMLHDRVFRVANVKANLTLVHPFPDLSVTGTLRPSLSKLKKDDICCGTLSYLMGPQTPGIQAFSFSAHAITLEI